MSFRQVRRSDFEAMYRMSRSFFDYADEDLPSSREGCYRMFNAFIGNSPYFKVNVENEIVGWFLAADGSAFYHSTIRAVSQLYCFSILKGAKGVKALTEFHKDYFRSMEGRGYQVVLTNSYLPNKNLFNRILIKDGWREGPVVLKKRTKWHPSGPELNETPNGLTQPLRVATLASRARDQLTEKIL